MTSDSDIQTSLIAALKIYFDDLGAIDARADEQSQRVAEFVRHLKTRPASEVTATQSATSKSRRTTPIRTQAQDPGVA
jgi:hypothetical protein